MWLADMQVTPAAGRVLLGTASEWLTKLRTELEEDASEDSEAGSRLIHKLVWGRVPPVISLFRRRLRGDRRDDFGIVVRATAEALAGKREQAGLLGFERAGFRSVLSTAFREIQASGPTWERLAELIMEAVRSELNAQNVLELLSFLDESELEDFRDQFLLWQVIHWMSSQGAPFAADPVGFLLWFAIRWGSVAGSKHAFPELHAMLHQEFSEQRAELLALVHFHISNTFLWLPEGLETNA